MNRVTLRDVAEKAGVSVSTASLALRGRGHLRSPTIKKIREAADEIGYQPDPILSSLGASRFRESATPHGTPLAIVRFPISHSLPTLPRREYVECLTAEARRMGYLPHLEEGFNLREMAAFLRVQYHRGVAGIVIVGQMPPEFLADRSLWRPFCIVQCGRYETSLPLHTVRSDINRSARLCWDRLVSAGCRRIGFAFGRHEEIVEDDEARFGAAFALPHLHAAGSVRLPPFDGLFADTAGVFDWFSRHRPDGVVLFHRGQYRELKRRGVRIPGDVSVTVTNVTMPAPGAVSEIAGLYHDPTEIARQCLRLLDVMVRHNERGLPESPRHLLIPPVWVDGASLGGVREKKSRTKRFRRMNPTVHCGRMGDR